MVISDNTCIANLKTCLCNFSRNTCFCPVSSRLHFTAMPEFVFYVFFVFSLQQTIGWTHFGPLRGPPIMQVGPPPHLHTVVIVTPPTPSHSSSHTCDWSKNKSDWKLCFDWLWKFLSFSITLKWKIKQQNLLSNHMYVYILGFYFSGMTVTC